MKTEQIRDYTALVLRRSEILLHSEKAGKWSKELIIS